MSSFENAQQFKSYWVESKLFPGKLAVVNFGTGWQLQGSFKTLTAEQMSKLFILKTEV